MQCHTLVSMKDKPRHYSGPKTKSGIWTLSSMIFWGNLFLQKQCKYVMNIEGAQGKDFIIYKSALFLRECAFFRIMQME